jgi:hypothetical protein
MAETSRREPSKRINYQPRGQQVKKSRFSTEHFGLDERQTQLLLSALNGIAIHSAVVPTTSWLSQEVYAALQESHADVAEFGKDLGMDESNPEIPLEYQDLLEKLQSLADWQSAALYFYACGFFEGQTWRSQAGS